MKYPEIVDKEYFNGLSPYMNGKSNILVSNFTPSNFKIENKEEQENIGANNSVQTANI